MIVRLTGTVCEVAEQSVVVEREGVGREVLIPHYALPELAAYRGRQVTLHTMEFLEGNPSGGHLTPRLLGFSRVEDREFFRLFVSVKGMGPRKALKCLAQPVVRIAQWIEQGDCKSLAGLPGIGKRAAELMVAELKGKAGGWALGAGEPAAEPEWSPAQQDALEVMVSLGDARDDAARWLGRAAQLHPNVQTADEWIRAAYRVRSGVEA